jgi:hypothetical protein
MAKKTKTPPVMKPLTFHLIDEGRVAKELDAQMAAVQSEILAHIREHREKAGKAKAELTLKIGMKLVDFETGTFAVVTSLTKKLPARPSTITRAVGAIEDDSLFVRASGSDSHPDPHQMKLATDDGRPIDATSHQVIDKATGEVLELSPPARKEMP